MRFLSLSVSGEQDLPDHDEQRAEHGRFLLLHRLRPDAHPPAPGQHQPRLPGQQSAREGERNLAHLHDDDLHAHHVKEKGSFPALFSLLPGNMIPTQQI